MNDAIKQLEEMPKSSISLILTDPPHGDRIPYLELSELWNSVLNANPDFSNEIVKTNAKGRKEISDSYESRMISFYKASMDKIKDDGVLAFIFNSTNAKEWKAVEAAKNYFDYLGAFPAYYSAGSVVQDNRAGSLKHDLVLLFAKKNFKHSHTKINEKFSEFIESWPDHYSANKTELEVVE
jgi:adenine-specific DNA methylase